MQTGAALEGHHGLINIRLSFPHPLRPLTWSGRRVESNGAVRCYTGFYGDKTLYKNLDLTQDFPNKILFHFLWEQNLA